MCCGYRGGVVAIENASALLFQAGNFDKSCRLTDFPTQFHFHKSIFGAMATRYFSQRISVAKSEILLISEIF